MTPTLRAFTELHRALMKFIAEVVAILVRALMPSTSREKTHNAPCDVQDRPQCAGVASSANSELCEIEHDHADIEHEPAAALGPGSSIRWPQIGGHDFVAPPRTLFSTTARASYEHYLRHIYLAACPGQRDLSRDLRVSLAKPGCCNWLYLKERMRQLSAEGYAAARRLRGGWSRPEPGWDDWWAMYLEPSEGPSPNSPVSVERRSLVVKVPRFVKAKQFDDAFDDLVRRGALRPWLDTPEGRKLCKKRGVDPYRGYRATVSDSPPEPAREICVVRIGHASRDVDRLIAIAEYVVAKSLGLMD